MAIDGEANNIHLAASSSPPPSLAKSGIYAPPWAFERVTRHRWADTGPKAAPDSTVSPVDSVMKERVTLSFNHPLLRWPLLFKSRFGLVPLRTKAMIRKLHLAAIRDARTLAANGADALVKLGVQKIVAISSAVVIASIVRHASAHPTIAQVLAMEEASRTVRELSGWLGQCAGEPISYAVELRLVEWWNMRKASVIAIDTREGPRQIDVSDFFEEIQS